MSSMRCRRRRVTPILDLGLMRIKTFRVSVIAGSLSRITQGAQPFLLPLMMQLAFGMSAAESGFMTFGTAFGAVLMKAGAQPILRRFGFRTTLIWNGIFSSLLYAICAAFRQSWPHWSMFLVLAICGFSMSLQFTAYNTVAYDDVPPERTASANSFYTTFQQLMLSFGICTGALALTLSKTLAGRLHTSVVGLFGGVPGRHRHLAARRAGMPRISARCGGGDERASSMEAMNSRRIRRHKGEFGSGCFEERSNDRGLALYAARLGRSLGVRQSSSAPPLDNAMEEGQL